MRKILWVVLAFASVAFADTVVAQQMPQFRPDSFMAKIQQRGTLNVGTKVELPGVGFHNPITGKMEGFAVDLAADLAERMFGKPGHVAFKPTLPITRVTLLQQGLIDFDIETMF